MKMEQSVPKRRHINSRRRLITQKKAYNIQNTAQAWNQEMYTSLISTDLPRIYLHFRCIEKETIEGPAKYVR